MGLQHCVHLGETWQFTLLPKYLDMRKFGAPGQWMLWICRHGSALHAPRYVQIRHHVYIYTVIQFRCTVALAKCMRKYSRQ